MRRALIAIVAGLLLAPAFAQSGRLPPGIRPAAPTTPKVERLNGVEAIVLFESRDWKLVRNFPSGYVDIYRWLQSRWIRVPLALEWRKNTHPMLAVERAGSLLIVGYDVVANLPSGRRLETVREGFDLYEIAADAKGAPRRIASSLDLGGIDTLIYGAVDGDAVHLCGGNRCVTVNAARGNAVPWVTDALKDYEFVEVQFTPGGSALALVRRKAIESSSEIAAPADSYSVASMQHQANATLRPVAAGRGIPWGLQADASGPLLNYARNREQFADMLAFDLSRMPFSGAMDFGANNLEGRVAWSQAYYLQGLASLARSHPCAPAGSQFSAAVRERVAAESMLLARLVRSAYPSLQSRRYSIDREGLVFALHLGRTAQVLRAVDDAVGPRPATQSALAELGRRLMALDGTVEQLKRDQSGRLTLAYRREVPFWADGVNVPHNYVSGYVSGLLASGASAGLQRAASVAKSVVQSEFAAAPFPRVWRYWGGLGDAGWLEGQGISLNTPTWVGNRGAPAHITYRTMDAAALLALMARQPSMLDERLADHFRALVASGWLLPSLNDQIRFQGDKPVTLDEKVASYYARSAAPWEIGSQVAALRQLTNAK